MKKSIFIFLLILICYVQVYAQVKPSPQYRKEVSADPNTVVTIKNSRYRLVVNTWNQSKVAVTIEGNEGQTGQTDEEVFKEFGVEVVKNQESVSIRTSIRKPTSVGILTIYMPAEVSLMLTNTQSNIEINDDLRNAEFHISYGTLTAASFKKLKLNAVQFEVRFKNADTANMNLSGTGMIADTVNVLDIISQATRISYKKGDYVWIRKSGVDAYKIEEIGTIKGSSIFSTLTIASLSKSFDVTGNNINIYIKSVKARIEGIRIIDKYAVIKFPLKPVTNYTLDFEGIYTPILGSLDKIIDPKVPIDQRNQVYAPFKFRSNLGDVNAKTSKIEIKCDNCQIDFR
jgi:hypothetical protein